MKKVWIHSIAVTAAAVFALAMNEAFAKDPRSTTASSLLPTICATANSLTPPPKEWAMFPQDEPPAAAPQKGQNPAQPNNAATPNAPGTSTTGGAATGSLVSVANTHSTHQRELPIFWLLMTGTLSLGAFVACGSLILRKGAEAEDIPVISELQEVTV